MSDSPEPPSGYLFEVSQWPYSMTPHVTSVVKPQAFGKFCSLRGNLLVSLQGPSRPYMCSWDIQGISRAPFVPADHIKVLESLLWIENLCKYFCYV